LSAEARYLEPELPDELDADYRRTFERLRGHFRVRGILPEEAADMAQEAAMRAYMHVRRRGMTGDTLFPLMNQIARNMLIDRHRRGGPQMVPLDDAEPIGDEASDPTERVVALEAHRAVREAVEALPDRHRDAILMALQGMTPAQVAERMGIARNAADALLHRARRSLKDRLRVVTEGALGLVTWAYLKAHGKRAGNAPAVAGAFTGSFGAAAAAIVIVLNVSNPVGTPAASASVRGGSTGRVVAVDPLSMTNGRGGAQAGGANTSPTGGDRMLVTFSREGTGGFAGPGKTRARVQPPGGGASIAGAQYEQSNDPDSSDTVAGYAQRAQDIACQADPTTCGVTP
jgi:RNA polymerase sigma-70 factor (ECF subfamily)